MSYYDINNHRRSVRIHIQDVKDLGVAVSSQIQQRSPMTYAHVDYNYETATTISDHASDSEDDAQYTKRDLMADAAEKRAQAPTAPWPKRAEAPTAPWPVLAPAHRVSSHYRTQDYFDELRDSMHGAW